MEQELWIGKVLLRQGPRMVPHGIHLLQPRTSQAGVGSSQEGAGGEKAGDGAPLQETTLIARPDGLVWLRKA